MNASELFEALAGLPGARQVKANGMGLTASRVLAGVEISHAGVVDERELRRVWRQRHGGGATPLVLVVDDPEQPGALRALGPLAADDPIRVVDATDLLKVLEALPSLSSLRAVRRLAEELERLDRSGTAGLVVKGLGTEYLYTERLRSQARWTQLRDLVPARLEGWRELLESLGYRLERLQPKGYVARYDDRPVIVIWPVADAAAFSRLDDQGRPPEGLLLNACLHQGAPYGLLAAGARLRLFAVEPKAGSAVASYLELDANALSEHDTALLGLLSAPYLAEGGFAALLEEAAAFGAELRGRLDRSLREAVLPPIGRELGHWAESEGLDLSDDEVLHELEAAALTLVFRVLFLMYAESAGHLPIGKEAYRGASLTQLVQDAAERAGELGARSTTLWKRLGLLVSALRSGDPALSVPAYNGALFASDGFVGAELLERTSIPDAVLGPALVALGLDEATGAGMDFSGLAVGHLGNIYEGLLSLRLSVADQPYAYQPRDDRYRPAAPDEAEVRPGELLWLTHEGGRKGGGVYYTPEALVRHLVQRAVAPAFERHLAEVQELILDDPGTAAERLFEFRVLDPACGSAHFLVAVVDELADQVARFLAEHPLPRVNSWLDDLRAGAGRSYAIGVEDAGLLRRLVLKRCIYGVDRSEMGAEIAKISLWLASFVPGLSLAYLDHNVRVGDSLVGVADIDQVREPGEDGTQISLVAQRVRDAIVEGAATAAKLVRLPDRTPDEVEESAAADREARERVIGARRMLDLWTAEALGLAGARDELWQRYDELAEGVNFPVSSEAEELASDHLAFHWPLAFPEVFADATRPGFQAVVGNPPWEEVNVEELGFYARYKPGIRALSQGPRDAAVEALKKERPELEELLHETRERVLRIRTYLQAGGYRGSPGNADLYKYFCQRYEALLRVGGSLGVVLPRNAFLAKGSRGFREWLFENATAERLDFLLNNRRWMFDTHPQYTVALLVARAEAPPAGHRLEVAGVANSAEAFAVQSAGAGVLVRMDGLGEGREVPLLPSQAAADLFPKLRQGEAFPYGMGRWRCFAVQGDFNETTDKRLWRDATEGWPLWKGESFYQYDPHGAESRPCPASPEARKKQRKPRPGSGSLLATEAGVRLRDRAAALMEEVERARVAFRDVTNRTNARTVITALIPPRTFLVNSAPYLTFLGSTDLDRACCLGLMNSIPFDWQARRFVEGHMNFFILEILVLPKLSDDDYTEIARAAARLSCVDDRYADFAEATGFNHGPLASDEAQEHLIEIDARVARAWELDDSQLDTVLCDFTQDAVPEAYRERLRVRLGELRDGDNL